MCRTLHLILLSLDEEFSRVKIKKEEMEIVTVTTMMVRFLMAANTVS
jgi:hypothetical protein